MFETAFRFTVPGPLVGKERPRKGKNGFYTPKKTKDYETAVGLIAKSALNKRLAEDPTFKWKMNGFYQVEILICHSTSHYKRPDIDNIIKIVLDGMNKVIYNDDRWVSELYCWTRCGDENGIAVAVNELDYEQH